MNTFQHPNLSFTVSVTGYTELCIDSMVGQRTEVSLVTTSMGLSG